MKLTILETGETAEVEQAYGERLVEQGKAVAAPRAGKAEVATAKKVPETEEPGVNAGNESGAKETAKKAGKKR